MKRILTLIMALTSLSTFAADDLMTPERLWAMGRLGGVAMHADGKAFAYAVTHFDVKANKSHTFIYNEQGTQLAEGNSPTLLPDGRIAYALKGEVWTMNADGTNRQQLTETDGEVGDFLFSPDGTQIVLVMEVDQNHSIAPKDADLPEATGMVINDLMYKHWDHYVTKAPHPFLYNIVEGKAVRVCDILEGEPYESPMEPFGGVEQLAWTPDGKSIAYTCRKKVGRAYAISTDSDIYLYDIATKTSKNLLKPADFVAPEVDATRSLANQAANKGVPFAGYDDNPAFSPDGRYMAFRSMERDGYESDRTRLCVMDTKTGTFVFIAEDLGNGRQSGVEDFVWSADGKEIYFTAVWHGRTNIYATNLKGEVRQLTDDVCDYGIVAVGGTQKAPVLFVKKHSICQADELYAITLPKKGMATEKNVAQLTEVNKETYDALTFGKCEERWIKTVDGKDMLAWVIYPPHFDANKKYPCLLFCEGGPQSPVSQFWSYRWNFQIMAANDYIIIAPNRRGLPGFGMEWLEEISGDYTGLCMQDYLSAIDDIKKEPYVDENRLGCVGASFGGFSVYWLAGNHEKRFKAFIAHDGIYNTQQQYVETEELWFPNWDMGNAPWGDNTKKVFQQSPHLFVQNWDTPILCIHGQKDFRIEYTQAESAFTAARMRDIDAQLLLFPNENHWVLKPQNGILWQRTFFRWLDKYLK